MHLKAHRYFAMVASTGSFSATARHFQVPASSVSRFIAALEVDVGQQLLYRNTRGVTLTDAGERYYLQIRTVLELLDAANEEIAGNAGSIRGVVRINAPAAFGRLHLGRLVIELQSAYPALTTELILDDRYIDPVMDGADIVLRIGQLEDSGLIGRQICEQRYVLCASPAYLQRHGEPDTPQALRGHGCLIHKGNGGAERWFFRHPAEGQVNAVDVTGTLRSNNSEVLLQAALAGKGIGFFPTWLLPAGSIGKGQLQLLLPAWQGAMNAAPSQMYLISPENRLRSHKVRAVWDFLLAGIGAPPYWDRLS
ncbi:LysR family transcriptional regulator [Duganella callida]|uniref:LysR family transcriptional regulator n=1 Tax=Duganella callida TaxID=2561932 RepID=A0A4Y9SLJ8_9BURK|nr:LysR family transcriptional regulator [Duganella callida]TFW22758.1 LysR family transcriptional regulator [Duganella callida]